MKESLALKDSTEMLKIQSLWQYFLHILDMISVYSY